MKTIVTALVAAAAFSSAANAGTNLTASPDFAAPAGSTAVLTFDNAAGTAAEANPLGIDVDFVPLSRRIDNTETVFDANGNAYLFLKPGFTDGSGFFGVAGRGSGVTFTTRSVAQSSISLFAGSIDDYNRIDLLDLNGNIIETITGERMYGTNAPFPGTDGDRQANKRLTFTGTDGTVYGGIRLYNEGTLGSFEFDQLAFTAAAVPEPATWAMMIAGFGLVGFAARRRGTAAVA